MIPVASRSRASCVGAVVDVLCVRVCGMGYLHLRADDVLLLLPEAVPAEGVKGHSKRG